MTADQGRAEAEVKIRTTRQAWMQPFVFGGIWLVFAIGWVTIDQPFFAVCWLVLGCASIVKAVKLRTMGVDLTPESANVRGVRRRCIPWKDVQAVVHHRRQGTWGVRLVLESGKPVRLPAPHHMVWLRRCPVRAGLPPHRSMVARAPRRVLATTGPMSPRPQAQEKSPQSPGTAPRRPSL